MYIKLKNGNVEKYPYSIDQLKQDNPQTSFPVIITNTLLAEFEVFEVIERIKPLVDEIIQNVIEETPNQIESKWYQNWTVIDLPSEEIELNKQKANEVAQDNRADAYKIEADPLFFKWQRGESTEQIWLDKVAEIKARFPKY